MVVVVVVAVAVQLLFSGVSPRQAVQASFALQAFFGIALFRPRGRTSAGTALPRDFLGWSCCPDAKKWGSGDQRLGWGCLWSFMDHILPSGESNVALGRLDW